MLWGSRLWTPPLGVGSKLALSREWETRGKAGRHASETPKMRVAAPSSGTRELLPVLSLCCDPSSAGSFINCSSPGSALQGGIRNGPRVTLGFEGQSREGTLPFPHPKPEKQSPLAGSCAQELGRLTRVIFSMASNIKGHGENGKGRVPADVSDSPRGSQK